MDLTYLAEGKVYRTDCSDDRIRIEDGISGGKRKTIVTAKADLLLQNAEISIPWTFHLADMFMTNGYQSWTETRLFTAGEYLTDLSKRPKLLNDKYHLRAYGSQAFWDMPSGVYQGFDFSYIEGRTPVFIGSRNFSNAYLLIRFEPAKERIHLISDCEGRSLQAGESFTVFDYEISENGNDYFASFTPFSDKKLMGYTSWYSHYQDINEEKLSDDLDRIDPRFTLFQIDDGHQAFVGDWLKTDASKFPQGLSPLIEKIHRKGLLAGIWLAPWVAEENSQILKEHPDWAAKDSKGRNISAGSDWSGAYPLDLNNQDAVAYIRNVLRHYKDLGFDFFKIDYLYAVNLMPLHGKTRSETSEFAYSLIREELPDKLILGCGATLGNACGRFDFCRVGPDASVYFDSTPHMRQPHPERISTKITLMNTIFRSPLDGRMFLNDPDVFRLHVSNFKMPFFQRAAMTFVNALFGSLLMTSDRFSDYTDKEKQALDQAVVLFERARVLSYSREDMIVEIHYALDGKEKVVYYDMQMGSFRDTKSLLPAPKALAKVSSRLSQEETEEGEDDDQCRF